MASNSVEAFPLAWPQGFKRSTKKKDSCFKCTLAQARDGVLNEIGRLKGTNAIISSNVPLKKDGNMYASLKTIDGDEGVAVYFTWKGDEYVLACDSYYTIRENLRAIEKSIEAIRGLDRWGVSDILSRAFTGFKALPAASPVNIERDWWEVLGCYPDSTQVMITACYNLLVKKYHPDIPVTGDNNKFLEIKTAYDKVKSTW